MGCSASVVLLLRSVGGAGCSHMCSRQDQLSMDAATPTLEGYTATDSPLTIIVMQEKPKLIDPLDYEAVISELGDELKEDPLRDLLLFPDNDFSVSTVPQERRTLNSTVPEGAELQAECLLVRQACKYYNSDLNVVQFKYDDYAGDYRLLPR
uniref:Dedicator of cytokinesis 10 n=2 Tax=Myripristis murdjan TaxID=586833 RepID=A0A667YCY2_9TELE